MEPVAVVIPARDDAADLALTVEAVLVEIEDHAGATIALVVGPSSDGTEAVAEALAAADPRVTVIDNPHGGIPQALNLGLAIAMANQAAVLARIDARARIAPGYLRRGLDTLAESGAAVGAVQRPVGHTDTEIAIAAAMASKIGSGAPAYRVGGGAPRPVDTAWMGIYRTDALAEVGGWDERFARNEDAELNARLAAAGHQVWLDPELVADYRPRPSLAALARQFWDYGWWRAHTVKRHPKSLAIRQLAAPMIVIGLAALAVAAVVWSPWFLAAAAGYFAVVVGAAPGHDLTWRQGAICRAALLIMHLCWGSGFIASLVAGRLPAGRPVG